MARMPGGESMSWHDEIEEADELDGDCAITAEWRYLRQALVRTEVLANRRRDSLPLGVLLRVAEARDALESAEREYVFAWQRRRSSEARRAEANR